jgi:PLP dependent protein
VTASGTGGALRADLVAARLAALRRRIEQRGRDPDAVTVVAVTKGFGPEAVAAALAAGITTVGENYADELLAKAALVEAADLGGSPAPRWHFLGAVQRRKVRDLAAVVSCWQTVARPEEGTAIAARSPGAEVFVQVDVSALPGRNGAVPSAVPGLVAALRGLELQVRGLMVVAPPGPPDEARAAFATVRELGRRAGVAELSMGMSGDLDAALAEGTTMVRIGQSLFGERPAGRR